MNFIPSPGDDFKGLAFIKRCYCESNKYDLRSTSSTDSFIKTNADLTQKKD